MRILLFATGLLVFMTGCTPLGWLPDLFCGQMNSWYVLDLFWSSLLEILDSADFYVKTGIFVFGIAAGALGLFAIQRIFCFLENHWKILLGVAACVSAVAALISVL
jgi:hypothetical protein